MKLLLGAALLCLCPSRSIAETRSSDALVITGQIGIGAAVPRARAEAQMSQDDIYGLRVSSADGRPMLRLDAYGTLMIGTGTPQGTLDLRGNGDDLSAGLLLRAGNSTSSVDSVQIAFGLSSATSSHNIRTGHVASQNYGNTMDFYLWNSTAQPAVLGSQHILSLQAISTYSHTSVHINPYGSPDVELEVSSGTVTGGGRIRYASSGPHSSRALKTNIQYFEPSAAEGAAQDLLALKHVHFRYKSPQGPGPSMRGLIYEEAPESIRGEGATVVIDHRVLNLELALQVITRKIAALEAEIARREAGRRLGGEQ